MNEGCPEGGGDRRAAERYQVALPVELEDGTGITSSVSTTGVVFETDRSFVIGAPIRFSLELAHVCEGSSIRLYCEGNVIRVGHHEKQWSVAVKIMSFQFVPNQFYQRS